MVDQDSRRVVVVTRPALRGGGLDRLAERVEVVRYAGAAALTPDQLVPLLSRCGRPAVDDHRPRRRTVAGRRAAAAGRVTGHGDGV
jgi:hypothetical protein